MSRYSDILIIYNPVSTSGQAEQKASRMAERLRKRDLVVTVQATDYAGHAETLAYQATKDLKHPLIISASGDGGYNEVINGVMRGKQANPEAKPVCAILPSGNANDHRRSVRKRPLTWAILHNDPSPMDLLELKINKDGGTRRRYAHSYMGVGLTAHAASLLNKEELGPIKEIMIVARSIFTFRPVAITNADGRVRSYDSLVFANVPHMSKVLRVGNKSDVNNGSFRVYAQPHRAQFWLFRIALNLLLFIFGLKKLPQQSSYSFGVPRNENIHLDGEVMMLPADAQATVSIIPDALQTIR
ncbi:MAG: diacylglycerol kinase [Patescibacteria group bacterium]|nr:diacylglycerol kinase [Patescibacteria group bacterium]